MTSASAESRAPDPRRRGQNLLSFRAKLFAASMIIAALALAVAGTLFAESMRQRTDQRIEESLVAEGRIVAELLARAAPVDQSDLQDEAVRLGTLAHVRVTLVGPDGRVVGDSAETAETLGHMENHAGRPEIQGARANGFGEARRYSSTLHTGMLYVAVPVLHRDIAVVRVALPLTNIRHELRAVVWTTLAALGVALCGAAILAWVLSGRMGARVEAIAAIARRYRDGDLAPAPVDYGRDELGSVARALDASVHELGRRMGELSRDRARMEAMLRSMAEGVIIVDTAGVVQLTNDAARRMLRIDSAVAGHHYLEAIRHPAIGSLVTAALNGEVPAPIELSPPRDPGLTVVAYAAPAAGHQPFGAALVLHDITELRRADQMRRDFVANISHELRTPLTVIRGYVELLNDDAQTTDDARRHLDVVNRNTARMETLLEDLLRLARLDAHQERLNPATNDTHALVGAVVADLTPAATARDQNITVAIGAGADTMDGDPVKLRDVVRNLVANAITHGAPHSTIRVEVTRTGPRIALAVLDEGPGVPEADLTRVFERFYRSDPSRAPGGTGLGLAIVKHLVELHGGDVRAANRPSGGAAFTITLPNA